VNDVPLVRLNKNESLPGPNQAKVTAVGLGRTVLSSFPSESDFPDHLMEASFQTISNVECIKHAGSWMIPESDLCCYDEKKRVCLGDSGGPLLLSSNTSQNSVQVSIVSRPSIFSSEPICVKAGVPQLFTRVSYYHEWIQENICKFSKVKPSSCTTLKPSYRRPTTKPIVKRSSIKPVS
jgi:secreted trypsin-like serine protease